jgi:hypothetical protein
MLMDVRSALAVVEEWQESTEDGSVDREGVVCATRHSAKSTSGTYHEKLRWSLSLTTALSLSWAVGPVQ